jgi:mannose-6-phosphate isomerase-like protein (cupin superfamily)
MKTGSCLILIGLLFSILSCNTSVEQKEIREEEKVVVEFRDHGPEPFVLDIEAYTLKNDLYRRTIWTGTHMQMTLMSLAPGEEIGLEKHPEIDQFLRIESGKGIVVMGDEEENLTFRKEVEDDFAVLIPAGKYHNVINTGDEPLKIYSIYTPPEHPFGTIHKTYEEGIEAGHQHLH